MGVLVVFAVLLALSAFLNAVNEIYQANAPNGNRPIKGYLQVVMLVAIVIGLVTVWVIVSGSSFGAVMAGLAALAAVLLLVFQSTILSVVASLTLTSNDMVRLDDWITVPGTDIDGDVIDIALHTVKVRNFDKTIGTIPTTMLVERPFINWRGIDEAGGRRIKRHLLIDQASVRYLTPEEISQWGEFAPLADYMAEKKAALEGQPGDGKGDPRRLTNLGTFRAYADAYLRAHPDLDTESFTAMVRQLQPRPDGLPVEIYAFTSTTDWAAYESTQADIFDHLIAGLARFDLHIAQAPTGADFSNLVE
jgi:miniconductance mechanosensitive channel